MRDTIIIGLGNRLLCDDSLGPRVMDDLRERLGDRGGALAYEENATCGIDLLESVTGYRRLILIDSIKPSRYLQNIGLSTGCWRRFDFDQVARAGGGMASTHGFNLATLKETADRLGMPFPADCHIIGIAAGNCSDFSEDLSPETGAVYDETVTGIAAYIESIMATQGDINGGTCTR